MLYIFCALKFAVCDCLMFLFLYANVSLFQGLGLGLFKTLETSSHQWNTQPLNSIRFIYLLVHFQGHPIDTCAIFACWKVELSQFHRPVLVNLHEILKCYIAPAIIINWGVSVKMPLQQQKLSAKLKMVENQSFALMGQGR